MNNLLCNIISDCERNEYFLVNNGTESCFLASNNFGSCCRAGSYCPYPKCKTLLHNVSQLLEHYRRKHGTMKKWTLAATNGVLLALPFDSDRSMIACPYQHCHAICSTRADLKTHLVDHVGHCACVSVPVLPNRRSKFVCIHPNCKFLFNSVLVFKIHMFEIHSIEPQCVSCFQTFAHMKEWYDHMHGHSLQGVCMCEFCKRRFSSLYAWTNHMRTHLLKLTQTNAYCDDINNFSALDKEIVKNGNKQRSENAVSAKQKYKNSFTCVCNLCQNAFSNNYHLEIHVSHVHFNYKLDSKENNGNSKENNGNPTDQILYNCFACDKTFDDLEMLMKHYKVHKVPSRILSEKQVTDNLVKNKKQAILSARSIKQVNNKNLANYKIPSVTSSKICYNFKKSAKNKLPAITSLKNSASSKPSLSTTSKQRMNNEYCLSTKDSSRSSGLYNTCYLKSEKVHSYFAKCSPYSCRLCKSKLHTDHSSSEFCRKLNYAPVPLILRKKVSL